MQFIECAQGSPEWHAARVGVITASRFADACTRHKKTGEYSEAARLYAAQLAIERISGEPCMEKFSTWQMRKGQELEPEARMAYEVKSGNLSREAGVCLADNGIFGYSTDGFIDSERGKAVRGCNEFKCLSSALKILEIKTTNDLSDYVHQIQGGLWIAERDWCDFGMYCPQLKNVGNELFVRRVFRDEQFIFEMESNLIAFNELVCENVRLLSS